MKVTIELDQSDLNVLADIVMDILREKWDNLQLTELFDELPEHIKGLAVQWGSNDTVFRDEVYRWVRDNKTR